MPSIPGATNVLPGVFTDIITQSRGVSIPGGSRIAVIMGEGATEETLVSQASGGGKDGLNPTYTSTSGADGRHFQLSTYPVVSNRVQLFKNGIPLVGFEQSIASTFSNKYDYIVDISTGRIALQTAHLVDQGGANYVPLTTNVGDGYLATLSLVDVNAPPETWTIRCVSVVRNALGNPIQNTAKFTAFGSVSGTKLDANGNPVIWTSNGALVSNGVLRFSIYETKVGGTSVAPFREGDAFTILVASGVLIRNDSLTATYIPTANLNDPVLLQGLEDVSKRHGYPSVDNNLSLGCQLAFANSASAVMTVQTAPSMPRRTHYVLEESVNALSDNPDDFIFPLPAGVTLDSNSNIHFFVTNNSTNVETQILPNKLDYYLLNTVGHPTQHEFIFDDVSADNDGHSYFYTVKLDHEVLATGFDGYISRDTVVSNRGYFSSSIEFDLSYVGKILKVIDASNTANIGYYTVTGVSGGKLTVTNLSTPSREYADNSHETSTPYFSDFDTGSSPPATGVAFEVVNIATGVVLDGYSNTDGILRRVRPSSAQATLTSATVNFNNIPNIASLYRLRINTTGSLSYTPGEIDLRSNNNGLYDISSPVSMGVTITKTLVDESDMRYEVLDLNQTSSYIVLNHNVVPNGNRLRVSVINDKDASFYDAGWIAALESLENVECDIVVPLPKQTISAIFQNALSHCKYMSNIRNKKERVLFCGAINGLTPDNLTGDADAAIEDIGILEGIQGDNITEVSNGNIEDLANYSVADAFGNTYRCVYFYPDQIVVQAGTENVIMDGFYIAAAAAGYESADIKLENPLTNKVLSGFTILRNKQFSTLTLEKLAAAGVTILQPVAGGGRVVWGITTTKNGYPEEQEISVVFIRDRVAKVLRDGFAPFIGQPESSDTLSILNTRAVILLNSLVSQGLITAYADLSVKRDESDPRQWNVSARVQPTYPTNWIYVKVGIGQL
jgi:hypothetical protein